MEKIEKSIKLKTYKDLIAWKKSYQLCLNIYELTKTFPKSEIFCLSDQIKRSALSVPSNIAEGYSRHQTKEYIRFLYISYASLAELETQLMLAKDLSYIDSDRFKKALHMQNDVQRLMMGLIRSLKRMNSI